VNDDRAALDLICHYASLSSRGRGPAFSFSAMSAASRTDFASRGFAISLAMSASAAGLSWLFVGNFCVISSGCHALRGKNGQYRPACLESHLSSRRLNRLWCIDLCGSQLANFQWAIRDFFRLTEVAPLRYIRERIGCLPKQILAGVFCSFLYTRAGRMWPRDDWEQFSRSHLSHSKRTARAKQAAVPVGGGSDEIVGVLPFGTAVCRLR
jgi:hypothetical protein